MIFVLQVLAIAFMASTLFALGLSIGIGLGKSIEATKKRTF